MFFKWSFDTKYIRIWLLVNTLSIFSLSCNNGNPVISAYNQQGKLVFVMTDTTFTPPGIYIMNISGTDLIPIAIEGDTMDFPGVWGEKYIIGKTTGPSMLGHPKWIPDGKKIVCDLMWSFDGYVLMMMNSDGSNKQVFWKVRAAAQQPQWSPEGDKILFTRTRALGVVIGTGIVDTSGENDRDFEILRDLDPYIYNGDSIWFVGDYQWGLTNNSILGSGSVNKRPESDYLEGKI